MNTLISRRLRAARERAGLTQEQLAKKLGFKDRQTLTAIETGDRKLAADELLQLTQILNVDLNYFVDEFRLDGEGKFSWRESKVDKNMLEQFEDKAGKWLAAYRKLGELENGNPSPLEVVLSLTPKNTYEDAQVAGERLSAEWGLGEVPAINLENAICEHLNTLIIYADAPPGISGAAFRGQNLNAIIINRNESEGRRHYDLAHELFHLLTWDKMPPKRNDVEKDPSLNAQAKRIEQLAEIFASALLMPLSPLKVQWEKRGNQDIHAWVNSTAAHFQVTAIALKWRLVNLHWVQESDIDEKKLVTANRGVKPDLFGKEFVNRFSLGLSKGHISVRRAAQLLGLSIDQLADLFRTYGFAVPFDI